MLKLMIVEFQIKLQKMTLALKTLGAGPGALGVLGMVVRDGPKPE